MRGKIIGISRRGVKAVCRHIKEILPARRIGVETVDNIVAEARGELDVSLPTGGSWCRRAAADEGVIAAAGIVGTGHRSRWRCR